MLFTSWLQELKKRLDRVQASRSPQPLIGRGRTFVPCVEALEDRIVPSTLTVVNNHDSGSGSLRAILASASSGDTIVFAKSVHNITLTSGELPIANSVTINGPGANQLSVSGNNASRVFEVDAGLNVTISGLTIAQGFAPDQGGGILNDGSNLTLSADVLAKNVAFESATNGGEGGALCSLGGSLTITGCQIIGNQAIGAAGPSAVGDADGGGIWIDAGSATLSDSTLSGNLAEGGDNSSGGGVGGGAIFTEAPTAITDCTISDSLARGGDNAPANAAYGGAIDVFASSTTITASTISGNRDVGGNGGTGAYVGDAEGGAINNYGNLTISDSTFDQNQAIGGSGGNSGPGNTETFEDYSFGGAIANTFASINITGSAFSNNKAVGGGSATATATDICAAGGAEGGAIYNELGSVGAIAGCAFDHNQAIGGDGNTAGGAVVLVGEALGGAIVSGYGTNVFGPNTLTVGNSTLTENDAQGGDNNIGTASVAGLVGAGAGAAIANYAGGTATVTGCDLDLNRAVGGHHNTAGGLGAVFAGLGAGGGIFNFLGNYNSAGYGLFATSVVTVSGSLIDLNLAQGGSGGNGEGGGIANLLSATTTLSSTTLILNEANGGSGAGLGGGAYNDATSSLTLTKSLVILNQANGATGIGGGIFTLGAFTHDPLSLIILNDASTSGDNIGT
jgi:hypothetical protein